jgi:hypothetical protein
MLELTKKLKLTGIKISRPLLQKLGIEYEIDTLHRQLNTKNIEVLYKFLEESTGVKPYAVGIPYLMGKSFVNENNENLPTALPSNSFYGDHLFAFFETEQTATGSGKVKKDFEKKVMNSILALDKTLRYDLDPKVGIIMMHKKS